VGYAFGLGGREICLCFYIGFQDFKNAYLRGGFGDYWEQVLGLISFKEHG